MQPVRLPDLGEADAVIIVEWFKSEGDTVQSGEELVEVETAKTTFVVEAPISGRLVQIHLQEGDTAKQNDILAEVE
ncbi:lipoyl domain-containing protein [Candidatus Bipolaricaulota bacterium]|nr:lipoyl domain-containing protein [Candidatus Bipolaricaulota bacterium]